MYLFYINPLDLDDSITALRDKSEQLAVNWNGHQLSLLMVSVGGQCKHQRHSMKINFQKDGTHGAVTSLVTQNQAAVSWNYHPQRTNC